MLSDFSEERAHPTAHPWAVVIRLLQLKLAKRNPNEEGNFFPKMDSLLASRCQLLKQILSISHSIFKK